MAVVRLAGAGRAAGRVTGLLLGGAGLGAAAGALSLAAGLLLGRGTLPEPVRHDLNIEGAVGNAQFLRRFLLVLEHGQHFLQGGILPRIVGGRGAVEFGDDQAQKVVELGLGLGKGGVRAFLAADGVFESLARQSVHGARFLGENLLLDGVEQLVRFGLDLRRRGRR